MAEIPNLKVNFVWDTSKFEAGIEQMQHAVENQRVGIIMGRRFGKTAMTKAVMDNLQTMRVLAAFSMGAWRRGPRD